MRYFYFLLAMAALATANAQVSWREATVAEMAARTAGSGVAVTPRRTIGTTNVYYNFTNLVPLAIGTVTTGAAGSSCIVTNVGTSNNPVLNFTIPRGDAGANGTNGLNGTNGISITGPTGPTGPAGANGTNGTNGINGTNGVALILTHTFTGINTSSQTWTHSYGSAPTIVGVMLNCLSNDAGMTAGQSVSIYNVIDASYSQPYFYAGSDATVLREGSINTDVSTARVTWNGTRNMVTNWANFSLTFIYQ